MFKKLKAGKLVYAAEDGDLEKVKYLLAKGVPVDAGNKNQVTALIGAAWEGHLEIVKYLIEKGADIEARDDFGGTALSHAASGGYTAIVRMLFEQGADIEVRDNDGETALMQACGSYGEIDDKTETLKFLIEKGADIEARSDGEWSALMKAAFHGHVQIAKLLIDRGAEINYRAECGWTALTTAASKGRMEMVKFLLDNGADINATKNKDGISTAVDLADRFGHPEVAEFLRQVEEGRPTGPDAAQVYIEEKETTTIRKVPLMVSKIVPTSCHACGAPFKGRAGDACEYCGSVIEAKEKMHKVDG